MNPVRKTDAGFLLTSEAEPSLPIGAVRKDQQAEGREIPPATWDRGGRTVRTVDVDLSKLPASPACTRRRQARRFTIDPGDANPSCHVGAHSDILFPLDDGTDTTEPLARSFRTKAMDGAETSSPRPTGLIYFGRSGNPKTEPSHQGARSGGGAYYSWGKPMPGNGTAKSGITIAPENSPRQIIQTLPAATIRKIDNPEKILRYWTRC
jgi:hypothetical protein